MKKHNYFLYNSKNKNVTLTKYKIYKKNKLFFTNIIRSAAFSNLKITFKKRFILSCRVSSFPNLYYLRGVCYISGKYGASISKFVFRKNTFKYLLNYNFIPNIWKKFK